MQDEGARLLDLLQAHGQQFLDSFDLSQLPRKRQRLEDSPEEPDSENKDFEEWGGFSNAAYSSEENDDDGLWLSGRLLIHYNDYIVRHSP
jgi:hypothetical protein